MKYPRKQICDPLKQIRDPRKTQEKIVYTHEIPSKAR